MPVPEQDKSMSPAQLQRNLAEARHIGAYPIDLWGAEWWYWRQTKHKDPSIWNAVKTGLSS
jgi:hypothetical protein